MSIHHVIEYENKEGSFTSFCGEKLWRHDMPIEAGHAIGCIRDESWAVCKNCINKIRKIIK